MTSIRVPWLPCDGCDRIGLRCVCPARPMPERTGASESHRSADGVATTTPAVEHISDHLEGSSGD